MDRIPSIRLIYNLLIGNSNSFQAKCMLSCLVGFESLRYPVTWILSKYEFILSLKVNFFPLHICFPVLPSFKCHLKIYFCSWMFITLMCMYSKKLDYPERFPWLKNRCYLGSSEYTLVYLSIVKQNKSYFAFCLSWRCCFACWFEVG